MFLAVLYAVDLIGCCCFILKKEVFLEVALMLFSLIVLLFSA